MANYKKETQPATDENGNIDIDAIVAKAVAEALAKQAKETAKKEKEVVVTEDTYKYIPDNVKVECVSNIVGTFVVRDDNENPTVNVTLANVGDKARLSYAQLMALKNRKPDILNIGMLAISRVFSEDPKITVKDIYVDLDLENLYCKESEITPLNIVKLFDEKVTAEEMQAKLTARPYMYDLCLEYAYHLFRQGKFNNYAKMSVFKVMSGKDNLFK